MPKKFTHYWLGLSIGILTFMVYLLTLSPSISTGDSAEFAIAVKYLGLPHPTGFPTYMLLAKLWTLVFPFGELIWRLNVLSALLAGSSIVFLFFILKKLQFSNLVSAISCFTLSFGFRFWLLTSSVHPYFLSLFFIALIIFLTLRPSNIDDHDPVTRRNSSLHVPRSFLVHRSFNEGGSEGGGQWLPCNGVNMYALFLVLALGLGTHLIFFVALPFVIIHLLTVKDLARSRQIFDLLLLVIIGTILLYSYIPLRAYANPALTWNYPDTLEKFTAYIMQKDYSYKIVNLQPTDIWARIQLAFMTLLRESLFLGVPLTLLGVVIVFRKNRKLFYSALIAGVLNLLLIILYGNQQDQIVLYRYLLPRMLIGTILMAYALSWLSRYLKRATAVFLILPLALVALHFQKNNMRGNFIIRDFARNILQSVEPNAVVITQGDLITMPLWYLQHVEKQRKDIIIVDANLIPVEWYSQDIAKKYPELVGPELVATHYTKRLEYFIHQALQKKEVFLFGTIKPARAYQTLPLGIVNKLIAAESPLDEKAILEKNKKLWNSYVINIPKKQWAKLDPLTNELIAAYSTQLNNLGVLYSQQSRYEEMIWALQKALEIYPENKTARENLSNYYKALKNDDS